MFVRQLCFSFFGKRKGIGTNIQRRSGKLGKNKNKISVSQEGTRVSERVSVYTVTRKDFENLVAEIKVRRGKKAVYVLCSRSPKHERYIHGDSFTLV